MGKSRPPLMMIHGGFCGPWAFDEFKKPFAPAGYKVHTPALRFHDGHKKPPTALGTTSLLDYAADLEEAIAELGETPILLGHSLGGLLAQMLAARGRARALILLAPSPPWGVLSSTLFEVASANAMFFAGDYWNAILKPDYGIAAANSLDKLGASERHAVYARFVPESGLATFEIMHWALDMRRAAAVAARDVTCPILCLAGSHDKVNPPSTVKRVAERYQGRALYEEVKGHSHWLIGEAGWEKIAARTLSWLDGVMVEDSAKTGGRS